MADDRCACGAPAVMFLASGVRCCLAHVPRDTPSIRSDVPHGATLPAEERALRWRLVFTEIARAEAVRAGAAAERILTVHGDGGAQAALRTLRGEPIVRER